MGHVNFAAVATLPDFRGGSDLYRYLDEAGFHALWIPDSQSLVREMIVCMTVAALNTERIQINGGVTNPLTRHPAVLAAAVASVDELANGRVGVSISTGDSAVFNLSMRPATLAQLEEYVTAIQRLYRDREATFEGREVRLLWPESPVPITIAAEGPKSLRLAGRIADGVIIGMGLAPEVVEGALGYLQEGLAEAGRNLEDIEVWWLAKWNIAASRESAIREIRMGLAASANHAFRFYLDGKFVPKQYHEPLRELQARYAFDQHSMHGDDMPNARLIDELGLTEFLADRFAIVGTLQDFIERCESLHALGVRNIRLSAAGRDHDRLLRLVGSEVLHRFSE